MSLLKCPNNKELEAFATILDAMEKEGAVLVGFKGINFETGKEVVIPSQTIALLVVSGAIPKEKFLRMMGKSENVDEYEVKVRFENWNKETPFGSTMS